LHALGSLPPKTLFPRTEDMRPFPGGVRGQYRPLREMVTDKGLHIVRWESEADYSPNCHASTPISSRLGRNCARVAPNWGLGTASLEVTSPRNIVPPGKPHRLLCEISYPDLIVPPGKRYRPCKETLSYCPGTNIVLPGNPHRHLREPISSHRGKVIVPLRKCT
jgi:hypothetical protein